MRESIAVNTFGSNHSCFIVYCANHQYVETRIFNRFLFFIHCNKHIIIYRTDCEVWIRSYWTKYVMVYPSFQSIEIGTQEITINGENFASDKALIKVKCIDSHNRILQCNIKWVNKLTGKEAIIHFEKPFEDKNTGKIFIRLDGDNIGWTKPVLVGIVTTDVNPYISMVILNSYFIFGLIPVLIFCFIWRHQQRNYKLKVTRVGEQTSGGSQLQTQRF